MNRLLPLKGMCVLLAALPLAACQSDRVCTLIGTPVGIQVDVAPPISDRVAAAEMEVCQAGTCRPARLELFRADRGGRSGFGNVEGLRKERAEVSLKLTGTAGEPVVERDVQVMPRGRFPNGPECGEGGPNAKVQVDGQGLLHEVP
ncbi:hypothetical protein ACFWY5_26045 [Nonomuraea sp. NPDC059007]|uniref:hypothetical protein n=1 Tax=Nonomuraea sp. NPDC059007 TaxID=3346692 RepID=UPI00367A279C